jgi:hypothetical protein
MDEPTTDVSNYHRESVVSAAQRDGALRAWRRRGALIIGAAVVIGAVAAALIVAWRGADEDGSDAQHTVGAPTTTTTLVNPTRPSSSVEGARTELARATLPTGEVVRFEEIPGNETSWCVSRGPSGQESSSCFGLGPMRPTVNSPQFTGPPAGPGFFTFVLPANFVSGVTVRDADGASVPSARSSDGTVLLVLDPAGLTNGPPAARPTRSFDLVAGDGTVVARVTTPGYAGTSGGPATDPRIGTVACLRAQGLAVPDLVSGPSTTGSTMRYPSELAVRGWQNCRDTYATAVPSSIALADQMARLDCMAAEGWLLAISSGPVADSAAFNAAMSACATQLPSRKALIACLQSRGLQVSEPPAQPFPAAITAAAWQQCRNAWTTASGAPAQIATRYDCMAGQGWIMALITGPPVDEASYGAASRNCP